MRPIPKSMKLNPDLKTTNSIIKAIMRNKGHCPCNKEKTPDTLCPCIDLVEKEICHCNLFVAKEEENNNVVN